MIQKMSDLIEGAGHVNGETYILEVGLTGHANKLDAGGRNQVVSHLGDESLLEVKQFVSSSVSEFTKWGL